MPEVTPGIWAGIWLGANYDGGKYVWANSKTPVAYNNFLPGQPDNRGKKTGVGITSVKLDQRKREKNRTNLEFAFNR